MLDSRSLLLTGGAAAASTTAALVALGRRHAVSTWAPLDAVSHIAWGDNAYVEKDLDVKHTVVGAVLNAGAALSWAAVNHWLFSRRPTVANAIASAVATSAVAAIVDFVVVPARLTPGFEWKLPSRTLKYVYGALALSLLAGNLVARARDK